MLNGTRTKCGTRLLRASLLQPLRDVATLNERYSCVGELLENEEMAFNVATCLQKLPKDLDRCRLGRQSMRGSTACNQAESSQPAHCPRCPRRRMCGCLSLIPAKTAAGTLHRIASFVQSFLLLKETMAVLPPLAEALAGGRCQLMQAVAAACGHAAWGELRQELERVLEEDAESAKNAFLNRSVLRACMGYEWLALRALWCQDWTQEDTRPHTPLAPRCRTQQCFAVKGGVDGFLDVARQTFCRLSEQASHGSCTDRLPADAHKEVAPCVCACRCTRWQLSCGSGTACRACESTTRPSGAAASALCWERAVAAAPAAEEEAWAGGSAAISRLTWERRTRVWKRTAAATRPLQLRRASRAMHHSRAGLEQPQAAAPAPQPAAAGCPPAVLCCSARGAQGR